MYEDELYPRDNDTNSYNASNSTNSSGVNEAAINGSGSSSVVNNSVVTNDTDSINGVNTVNTTENIINNASPSRPDNVYGAEPQNEHLNRSSFDTNAMSNANTSTSWNARNEGYTNPSWNSGTEGYSNPSWSARNEGYTNPSWNSNSDTYTSTEGNTSSIRGVYSRYPDYRTSSWDSEKAPEDKKNKETKKAPGFLKKAINAVALGVIFGAVAGGAFFAVCKISGRYLGGNVIEMTASDNVASQFGANAIQETTENIGNSGVNLSTTTVVESDISAVVEDVMPAMVSIINNYTETTQSFWGQTFSQEASASGSGIIVSENDKELLIATNAHVVEGATSLEVTFIDDSKLAAKIKGMDVDMDLAVIAVTKSDISEETKNAITIATLGDSDNLKLGEPVIAIGNALGYGQSVTNGIVSALNREIAIEDGSMGTFIQTNAAINPGNSGGALLNIRGEVIGINSNKIGGSTVEGMGYAIPITSASPIITELLERKTREVVDENKRGYIGISLQEVTREISMRYNMPEGIYVVEVTEGSGAEGAGLIVGDIITKFDGQSISSYSQLQELLQYYSVGEKAKITYERFENGAYTEYDSEIVLGKKPKESK